mgnify:CR=1 FL=1
MIGYFMLLNIVQSLFVTAFFTILDRRRLTETVSYKVEKRIRAVKGEGPENLRKACRVPDLELLMVRDEALTNFCKNWRRLNRFEIADETLPMNARPKREKKLLLRPIEIPKITLENEFWRYNEASWSHGYPATSWLQLAIMYGCGLYTAQ